MIVRVGMLVALLVLMVVVARLERRAHVRRAVEAWGVVNPWKVPPIVVTISVDVSQFRESMARLSGAVEEYGWAHERAVRSFEDAADSVRRVIESVRDRGEHE